MLHTSNNDSAAQQIVDEAFKCLNIRVDGTEAKALRVITAGVKDKNNPHEIIACSIEKNYLGLGSEFHQEIEKVVIERMKHT